MNVSRAPFRLSDRLTSRRGAWVSLGIVLGILVLLFGGLSQVSAPTGNDAAPADSESARVSALLAAFPNADQQSVLAVASREDSSPLSATDVLSLEQVAETLGEHTGLSVTPPLLSENRGAAVLVTPITLGADNAETAEIVRNLRSLIATDTPAGLNLLVTGGPAFGADITSSFDGADFTLLAVTIGIVAILLIITYRSPVLWLIPLTVVAIADRVAGLVAALLGNALDLQFDGGIISVLVFGAGTNYALLLISRYREELLTTADHRVALSAAWRNTVPAILASNLTVVLALLTLVFAVIPGTRGLGLTSAAGLLIALLAALFMLPQLLAIFGRNLFWPFVPRPGSTREHGRAWNRVATTVVTHPWRSLGGALTVLAIMSAGIFGTSIGLTQVEKFRVQSESAAGLEVLSEYFPAGESQPIMIVTKSTATPDVLAAIEGTKGIVRAHPTGETADGTLTKIMVTGEYAPGTDESLELVQELRTTAHSVTDADALVGGAVATDLDARAGNEQDLLTIAPLVLGVSFIVLLILLRSLLAPVLLLTINMISAFAAIGAGSWLSRVLFDQSALDLQVPLLAFLFLVALGIDYTIFLVHRARSETISHGTREGMVLAVTHTGSVITSAGIVLAAVFAALGVLPLVTLGQLGLIVGVGVVVDTLLVRTVIVPALFGIFGDRMWWPRSAPTEVTESSA